jgi:hypothetical protein
MKPEETSEYNTGFYIGQRHKADGSPALYLLPLKKYKKKSRPFIKGYKKGYKSHVES